MTYFTFESDYNVNGDASEDSICRRARDNKYIHSLRSSFCYGSAFKKKAKHRRKGGGIGAFGLLFTYNSYSGCKRFYDGNHKASFFGIADCCCVPEMRKEGIYQGIRCFFCG